MVATLRQSLKDGLSSPPSGPVAPRREFDFESPYPSSGKTPDVVMREMDEKKVVAPAITLPSDRPPYYFKIDVFEYERKSWRELGSSNLLGSVVLPIPTSIIDNHAVSWSGEEIGIMGAGAGGVVDWINGGMSWPGQDDLLSGGTDALSRGGKQFAGNILGRMAPGIGAGVENRLGVAINNYLTMMLKGPTYKEHDLTWSISPNSEEESRRLVALHKLLNDAAAPDIFGYGSAFFAYPRIFRLSFNHDDSSTDMGKILFRFKPSVLATSSWNFTPMNVPAFYAKSHAPETVQFSLKFVELEFWLRGDYLK